MNEVEEIIEEIQKTTDHLAETLKITKPLKRKELRCGCVVVKRRHGVTLEEPCRMHTPKRRGK